MIGAIEAGGTKFVCAVFSLDGGLINRISVPTESPNETIPKVMRFFEEFPEIKSIGIGSFGPIGVNKQKNDYGFITSTPKLKWKNYPFKDTIQKAFPKAKIAWTTDVNAAAYGELKQGAGINVNNCVYITVGTGIGAGVVVNGQILDGFSHPEAGHMAVNQHTDDHFEGVCPYHGVCLEGLASGPSIEERWGKSARNLSENDNVWNLEAYYLAQAIYNFSLMTSTEKIILGGGVMKQKQLLQKIKIELNKLNNEYINLPSFENYVVLPKLGDNAGITGCYELAKDIL